MKKAEEWDMTHPGDSAIEFIEKIQQDAYAQGVRDAHKIQQETPPSEHWECGKAILSLLTTPERETGR